MVAIIATGCQDCDRESASGSAISDNDEDQEARTPAAAIDDSAFEDIDCVELNGDADGNRRLIYGAVIAFDNEYADVGGQRQDAATERGTPIPQVAVALTSTADTTRALAETITDDQGRWCVDIGTDLQLEPSLMAVAELDDLQLRRPIIDDGRNDITAFDEALVRLLVDEGHQFQHLRTADYRRLAERARDVVEDLDTASSPSMRSVLSRLVDTMEADAPLLEISDDIFEDLNPER